MADPFQTFNRPFVFWLAGQAFTPILPTKRQKALGLIPRSLLRNINSLTRYPDACIGRFSLPEQLINGAALLTLGHPGYSGSVANKSMANGVIRMMALMQSKPLC